MYAIIAHVRQLGKQYEVYALPSIRLRILESSYTFRVAWAVFCQLNFFACCNERALSSRLSSGLLNTLYNASVKASISSGSMLSAASPTTSGSEVRLEHTTGV